MMNAFLRSRHNRALLVFCVVFLVIAPGVAIMETTTDAAGALLNTTGEATDIYQRYLREFKADYGGIVLVSVDCLPILVEMVKDLEDLPMVDKVEALLNSTYVTGFVDEVQIDDFSEWAKIQDRQTVLDVASAYKPFQGKIISDDQKYLAVYVRAKKDEDLPKGVTIDAVTFTKAIEEVLAKYDTDNEMLLAGEMYYSTAMSEATAAGTLLLGVIVLVMMVTVGIMTRSVLVGFLAGINGGLATLFCFGLMGYMGIKQNPLNAQSVNLLVMLGAALTLLANEYIKLDREWLFGIWPKSAIKSFILGVLTTAIGFGWTADSSYVVVQQLGWLGVFGIIMCLFTTTFLVFPLLTRKGLLEQHEWVRFPMPTVQRRYNRFFSLMVGLTIFGLTILTATGLQNVKINYDSSEFLADDHPARVATDKVADVFGSRYTMALVIFDIDALDPDVWKKLDTFCEELKKEIEGIEIANLSDSLSVWIQAMTADREKPLEFPDSRELFSAGLYFFDPVDTDPYVNFNKTAIAVLLQTPFSSSEEYRRLRDDVAQFADDTNMNAVLTGRATLYYEASDNISRENLESLWKAMGTIFVLFLLFFRSFRVAIVAIIANIFPVLGCLSLYGWMDIPLDTSTSLTMVIAFGMIVDDTIHLVLRFLHNVKDRHLHPELAASLAARELRRPILQTTITITIGFVFFFMAELLVFHSFGKMMILVLIYACIVWDLTFLPWLLGKWGFSRKIVKTILTHTSLSYKQVNSTPLSD